MAEPFRYDRYQSPYVSSISQLIAAPGEAYARAAELGGNAQANAQLQSGQAWGNAAQNIGQAVAAIPGQIQQQRAQQQTSDLRGLQLQEAQQQQQGRATVDRLMAGDQLAPGATGPRKPSYFDANGLFDIPSLTAELAKSGIGHLAPELLKGAEQINDSVTKHRALEQQATLQQSLLVGDMAAGALKLSTLAGMPLPQAMDFVVQPALNSKSIKPEDYASIREKIMALPPEQQMAALTTLMDAAAKLDKGDTLAKDAKHVDRYGRTESSNIVAPTLKTRAELAADAANPSSPTQQQSATALGLMTPAVKRTESELALDTFAKSIGKQKAEDLTYQERQQFDKDKARVGSDQAFAQHQRERQYDLANPVPEKAEKQSKLEQEYRTVLARGLSSRSGGLGLEDAKVQQANHLLALLDQTYDPKTDTYSIPKVLQGELSAGLARLVAPGGSVGVEMMREFESKTAKGDLAGALTYITGTPVSSATQDIAKMLKDSILRQGQVALENREGEMRYLRGLAPTDLEEERRTALEANSLNPLRQSRVIKNTQTGERKVQVSLDGGKTWK